MDTARRDIVVIGGSAGSLEALSNLVCHLPGDLAAALFVVVHVLPVAESHLPRILDRRGALRAKHAREGDAIRPGRILVAPPDHHMLLRRDRVELSRGPRENSTRPAIDPLFRTAAAAFGRRVCGIVLSGNLDDGSEGLRQIVAAGGMGIVQDPAEALHPEMPRNALARCSSSRRMPVHRIGRSLAEFVGAGPTDGDVAMEAHSAQRDPVAAQAVIGAGDSQGTPTGLSCPECHGVLWASPDPGDPTLHCRIGHAYTLETLQSQRRLEIEQAMNAAVRALHEDSSLARHIAEKAERGGRQAMAHRFSIRAQAAISHARVLENLLRQPMLPPFTGEPIEGDGDSAAS